MALRQLMLNKELEGLKEQMNEISEKEQELEARKKGLEESIEEIETEEEKAVVEEEVQKYEDDKEALEAEKKELEEKIKGIEDEQKGLEEKSKEFDDEEEVRSEVKTEVRTEAKKIEGRDEKMNYEVRDYIQNEEVRSFYEQLRDSIINKRAVTGGELLIPQQVMTAIEHRIGDYGVLINEVRNINLSGTGRITFNAGTPTLYWTEMCEALKESTMAEFKAIELDGFKLGGYLFICNALIKDSIINLAEFVEKEFAKGIAKYIDDAIMNGKGATSKQPEGIKTKVTKETEVKDIIGLLGAIGELDHGEQKAHADRVIVAMNRPTWYKRILPQTYGKNADGRLVYDGMNMTLPDGTKVVLTETLAADEVVIGDFYNGYVFATRAGASFDMNDCVRWIEEETGFKVSGRYDGKVTNADLFKRVKFKDATPQA